MESAEQAAVSAPRDGNVSPKYYASQRFDTTFVGDGKTWTGQETFLSSNRHFDHLAVNTSLSTVLLPAGVKDIGKQHNHDIRKKIKVTMSFGQIFVRYKLLL